MAITARIVTCARPNWPHRSCRAKSGQSLISRPAFYQHTTSLHRGLSLHGAVTFPEVSAGDGNGGGRRGGNQDWFSRWWDSDGSRACSQSCLHLARTLPILIETGSQSLLPRCRQWVGRSFQLVVQVVLSSATLRGCLSSLGG